MTKHSFDKKMLKNPLVRQMVKEIKDSGYKFSFCPSWKDIGICEALGSFDSFNKEVLCTRYSTDGKLRTLGEVVFILAHEIRHIQHKELNLYKKYYASELPGSLDEARRIVETGIKAERDCDRYAKFRIKDFGVYTSLVHRTYSPKKVGFYSEYKYLKSLGKGLSRIEIQVALMLRGAFDKNSKKPIGGTIYLEKI